MVEAATPGTTHLLIGSRSHTRSILTEALRDNPSGADRAIYVTFVDPVDAAVDVGHPVEGSPWTDVIDASDSDTTPTGDERITRIRPSGNLHGIGLELTDRLRTATEEGVRVGIDSVSEMLSCTDPDRVEAFLRLATRRIRQQNALGLLLVDAGVHDDNTMETLAAPVDGVIDARE